MKRLIGLTLLTLLSASLSAKEQIVTLSVDSMTCAVCPLTVQKVLEQVDGVHQAEVTYKPKEAVITYDDAQTEPEALTAATANAGYSSVVKVLETEKAAANE